MQQIFSILALLPSYLVISALLFVIFPTIMAILLRYTLYRHLHHLRDQAHKLIGGFDLESIPKMISKLERRFIDSHNNREINTASVIEGVYSQEKFYFFGKYLGCDFIDDLCNIIPNLLLAFGLLGTFLGITLNLAGLSQTITQIDVNNVKNLVEELNKPLQGMGVAFTASLLAIACSALLTVFNLSWNTNIVKSSLLSAVEDYIDNIYLPKIQPINLIDEETNQLSQNFEEMLEQLGKTIEMSMTKAFARIEIVASND
ncbi:hypothetical protein NIES4102_32410 [Chondrocystis sp. NIES-4102]|nr:hypothetical protein NIES4102_32410 [Chondrocystis sp. NIES-4102]